VAEAGIVMYGAEWCSDTRRAKRFFAEHNISYKWVDIEIDKKAAKLVKKINQGKRVIPTIIFEDGSILVEPTNAELREKLGIRN
jgi:glutaredoxin-like protein